MCVRSQHLTLSGESTDYYAFPFALGNLVADWTNYYEGTSLDLILFGAKREAVKNIICTGLLFTEYESGPWLALKSKDLSGTSLRWVGLGEASDVLPGEKDLPLVNLYLSFVSCRRFNCCFFYICLSLKMIKASLGVWRHTCLSVDFQTGKLILVENGQLLKETVSEELTQMFQVFAFSNSLSD